MARQFVLRLDRVKHNLYSKMTRAGMNHTDEPLAVHHQASRSAKGLRLAPAFVACASSPTLGLHRMKH